MTAGIERTSHQVRAAMPVHSPSPEGKQKATKRKRLTRLVSQDDFGINAACQQVQEKDAKVSLSGPPISSLTGSLPTENPLEQESLMSIHLASLRLEAELYPLRLILSRLMGHPAFNRKGVFNQPVDPVALKLPDYCTIVKRPMDLGTVKKRLHALAYKSRDEAAEDIRLVFTNAASYNPPHNFVHQCAKNLLAVFEEAMAKLSSKSNEYSVPSPPVKSNVTVNTSSSRIEAMPALSNDVYCRSVSFDVCPAQQATVDPKLLRQSPAITSSVSKPIRKSRLPPFVPHCCESCKGRKCGMCHQGCLTHEPALIVCQGVHCSGSKIRKGVVYYVTQDGQRHFCQRCYGNLPPILPNTTDNEPWRYKQDLLKRKNDEEIPEDWIECSKCSKGVHYICAMKDTFVGDNSNFVCPDCHKEQHVAESVEPRPDGSEVFTFISGQDDPVALSSSQLRSSELEAASLPECAVSSFIQSKVQSRMKETPNADKTITVRVISDTSRKFAVPDVVRRHFRMAAESDGIVKPPSIVRYRQKAITLFQKIDGLDVCIFCMYVQEYDGDDDYECHGSEKVISSHSKRVYIAYLDSVEHFRPRECRTEVYQEILVSYLATARARGYHTAQIWACPPSRGNSFIFWNHPSSQRTPTPDRLISWYHGALSRAIDCGVVTDVKSLFESDFQKSLDKLGKETDFEQIDLSSGRMFCPPLLEGDYWIDEAVRVHGLHLARNVKVRGTNEICVWDVAPLKREGLDPCPAIQVATLVKDRIMTHPSSVPFRRPVNAAALKIKNYHKIIAKPMDLGTIYSRCTIGEYHNLKEVVMDFELVVANAKKFNPVGHYVHNKADEIRGLFFQELQALLDFWATSGNYDTPTWEDFSDMSMSLDKSLDIPTSTPDVKCNSVVIEDDRSSDGSRSLSSGQSLPPSPISRASSENEISITKSQPKKSARVSLSLGSMSPRPSSAVKKAPPRLCLHADGPEAVLQRMVGEDLWMLDKRGPTHSKRGDRAKKANAKRRRSMVTDNAEVPSKRRRQSWLGEQISDSIRRMRTSFFACSLEPKDNMSEVEQKKALVFQAYVDEFDAVEYTPSTLSSPITNARHAFLEFSQFRHFEFDTLRRAKYSTAMLLYHLNNKSAAGVVPVCNSCDRQISEVRWHKVKKASEKRRVTKKPSNRPIEPSFVKEELCGSCHQAHSSKDEYIPIPVSLKQD